MDVFFIHKSQTFSSYATALLASVYDSDGVWGTSSGLFRTAGDPVTNTSCIGMVTTIGSSYLEAPIAKTPHANTIAIIVVASVITTLVIGVGGIIFWRRRKVAMRKPGPEFTLDSTSMYEDGIASGFHLPYDPPSESKFVVYRSNDTSFNIITLEPPRDTTTTEALTLTRRDEAQLVTAIDGDKKGSDNADEAHLVPASQSQNGITLEGRFELSNTIRHEDRNSVQGLPPPYVDSTEILSQDPALDTGIESERLLKD